jgi:hypothetical protein
VHEVLARGTDLAPAEEVVLDEGAARGDGRLVGVVDLGVDVGEGHACRVDAAGLEQVESLDALRVRRLGVDRHRRAGLALGDGHGAQDLALGRRHGAREADLTEDAAGDAAGRRAHGELGDQLPGQLFDR